MLFVQIGGRKCGQPEQMGLLTMLHVKEQDEHPIR